MDAQNHSLGTQWSVMSSSAEIATVAQDLLPELVAIRRELHQIPEVGLDLPQTQAVVLRELEGLPLEISVGTDTTSVTAVLRGAHPGPVVLLRGDMDGLPVTEVNDLPYRSTNGNMHACRHELHTTGLIGAARLLSERRDQQSMITRRFDVFDPVVISVTQLQAGDALNVIPEQATLGATVRTMSAATLEALPGMITDLTEGIARGYGCTADISFTTQYIPTVNADAEHAFAVDQIHQMYGEDSVTIKPHGIMGSDDFSFVLAEIPGAFMMVKCLAAEQQNGRSLGEEKVTRG